MHRPYESILKHPPDFRVSYRFYSQEEGGRHQLPFQGIRSDFCLVYPDGSERIHMIWPEFEDTNGAVILDNTQSVPCKGTARMWILVPERRIIHRQILGVGAKGYFFEGKKTAECTIIEILALMTNPDKKLL